MTTEHAPLLPCSGAPQWGHCSGSVQANRDVPNDDTPESRAGTATHWVGSQCLENWRSAAPGLPLLCPDWIGQTAPNGVVIDREMAEGAEHWVADVLTVAQAYGGLQNLLIEHRVHCPQIHDENWGTLDTGLPLLHLPDPVIFLWDYKHGHREARACEHFQLIDYLSGLANEMDIRPETLIIFRIVQPRCYRAASTVNEWVCTYADLQKYFNQLSKQAYNIVDGCVTTTAGVWCRDCAAVGRCATARKAKYSFFDYVNQNYEIDAMSDADLAVERDILREGLAVGQARLEAIEAVLEYSVGAGNTGSGLALGSKPGNNDWIIPAPQVISLCRQFGVDADKNAVITPTQAVARAPKETRLALEQTLKTVTQRKAGKLKLTRHEDTPSARAFGRKINY